MYDWQQADLEPARGTDSDVPLGRRVHTGSGSHPVF
jgi:hypothetical protein